MPAGCLSPAASLKRVDDPVLEHPFRIREPTCSKGAVWTNILVHDRNLCEIPLVVCDELGHRPSRQPVHMNLPLYAHQRHELIGLQALPVAQAVEALPELVLRDVLEPRRHA